MTGAFVTSKRRFHRVGRDVRDVDHHAEAIHLANDFFAERREAAAARDVGPRIGPVERVGVGERHVAGAQLVKLAQDGDRVFDRVAPFHADQRGDLAGLGSVRCRRR